MKFVWSLALLLLASTVLLAQSNPVPLISQPLVPASAAPGGKGFNLTVNGTGFTSASVVEWNGVTLTTTVVSNQKLTAKVPASRIAKVGTASVTVVNPGATPSNTVYFPVATSETSLGFNQTQLSSFLSPYQPVAGDFNNDGKLDIVFNDSGGLAVMLGNGDGTFGPANFVQCAAGFVSVADVNGDGNLDVVSSGSNNATDVCLGAGDGTLTLISTITSTADPGSAIPGDFNQDGKLDLAIITSSDNIQARVEVWLGHGDGTFQMGQSFEVGSCSSMAATGDFNGDGALDLAIPDFCGGVIAIVLGNGDGTFQTTDVFYPIPVLGSVAVADFNRDGKLDIAASGCAGICILSGNGDGTFQNAVFYAGGGGQIVVGDLNGDGILDLASPNFTGNAVSVLLGKTDGTFQTHVDFADTSPQSITIGDFNRDGRLDFAIEDFPGTSSIAILLQSPQPTAVLSPSSLAFAAQDVGVPSASQRLTLTNTGAATLTLNSITFIGTNPGDFSQTNTCGTTVAPGASCTINVTFTPTMTGTRTASLSVSDNASGSPQFVSLTGTGVAPAVTLSTTSLTFATQVLHTQSAPLNVTLTNSGTGTLNIASIVATGDFTQTNTCGSSVGVGASCTISVQFTPSQKGARNGSVTITDDAPGSPQIISLTGCGTVVKLSAIAVNFGNQKVGTTSAPVSVTMTNVSGQTLSISSISITGSDPADFAETNTCGSSLAGHASCKISVTFKPTATGARSATLSISDNGGCSPQQVSLSGTGT